MRRGAAYSHRTMKGWRREERDWEYISSYFRNEADEDDSHIIDDKTWDDLDLNAVYREVDRTRSSVGQAVLYSLLRHPMRTREEFERRDNKIRLLAEDETAQSRLSRILSRLGYQWGGEVYGFLCYMATRIENGRRYLFLALSLAAPVSLVCVFLFGSHVLPILGLVAVINLIISLQHKAKIEVEAQSFGSLHKLLVAGEKLARVRVPSLSEEMERLRAVLPTLRKLKRKTVALVPPGGNAGDIAESLFQYVRIFLLLDVTAYYFVHNEAIRLMPRLKEVYATVGDINALLSVVRLRRDNPGCVTPEISSDTRSLLAEDVVHPLLEHPVPNSVTMNARGAIITGSNMSGKSTFLRTLGVNQVLASTLCVAFAGRFCTTLFRTMTSITNRDDITRSESHYFAEAKRMLAVLRAMDGPNPALVIIDEILAGTNSQERISASVRILRHMAGKNGVVVAATHDREIALALQECYANLHFTHVIDGKALEFDYKLRAGIVEHGNAVRLLQYIGFPREIIGDGE